MIQRKLIRLFHITFPAYTTFAEGECPERQGLEARNIYAVLGEGAKIISTMACFLKCYICTLTRVFSMLLDIASIMVDIHFSL